jgi:NAD+ synthase
VSLKINPAFTAKVLENFIRDELAKSGFKKAVLGLSGGLDSTVCVYLATRALRPRDVLGLIMPYGDSFPAEIRDAAKIGRILGIRTLTVDIAPQVDAYFSRFPTRSRILRGNKMARERMSVLYDHSAREKALILGTSNKTELLIGYGTVHGDMACGINPMGDLYKTQVRELARYLGVPTFILKKTPTAGLWTGQTDEQEIGLTYPQIDEILEAVVELKKSPAELLEAGFPREAVKLVTGMIRGSEFKRKLPPIAKLSPRSVGHDFLYPYDWGK